MTVKIVFPRKSLAADTTLVLLLLAVHGGDVP